MYHATTCFMKKIAMMAVAATLALSSCNHRRAGDIEDQGDPTGSVGAASPEPGHDSLHNPSNADSMRTDGYKADSVTPTYPIPR